MELTLIETKNGFIYNNKHYKWGNCMIDFLNFDFSNYYNIVKNLESNLKFSNKLEPNKLKEVFTPLFDYKTNLIQIELIKCFLTMIIEDYDNKTIPTTLKTAHFKKRLISPDSIIYTPKFLINYINEIKNVQRDYSFIFIDYIANKRKSISTSTLSFLNKSLAQQNMQSNMKKNLVEILPQGIIKYSLTFYNVESFCNYTFFKVVENRFLISLCPNCDIFFQAENGKQKYCCISCKRAHFKWLENNNAYRKVYNKFYKDVDNYCSRSYSTANQQNKQRDLIINPFKKIYHDLKQPIHEAIDEDNFNLFIKRFEKQFNDSGLDKILNKEFYNYLN